MHEAAQASAESSGLVAEAVGGSRFRIGEAHDRHEHRCTQPQGQCPRGARYDAGPSIQPPRPRRVRLLQAVPAAAGLDGSCQRRSQSLRLGFRAGRLSVRRRPEARPDARLELQRHEPPGPGQHVDALQDILFVASEKDDTIFALRGAGRTHTDLGTGTVVYQDAAHLHGPLGLIFAPNGDLLVANADPNVSQDPTEPSEIVEFTRSGSFVRQYSVDPNLGSAFALGVSRRDGGRLRGTVREDVTSSQPASNARWCSARIPRAVSATIRSSLPPGRVGRLVTRCLRIIVRPGRGVILPSFAMVLGRLGSLETEDTRQHGTPRSSIPVAMRGSVLTPARTVAQKGRGPPWWPP